MTAKYGSMQDVKESAKRHTIQISDEEKEFPWFCRRCRARMVKNCEDIRKLRAEYSELKR